MLRAAAAVGRDGLIHCVSTSSPDEDSWQLSRLRPDVGITKLSCQDAGGLIAALTTTGKVRLPWFLIHSPHTLSSYIVHTALNDFRLGPKFFSDIIMLCIPQHLLLPRLNWLQHATCIISPLESPLHVYCPCWTVLDSVDSSKHHSSAMLCFSLSTLIAKSKCDNVDSSH